MTGIFFSFFVFLIMYPVECQRRLGCCGNGNGGWGVWGVLVGVLVVCLCEFMIYFCGILRYVIIRVLFPWFCNDFLFQE